MPQLLQNELNQQKANRKGMPQEEFKRFSNITRSAFDGKAIHAAVQSYIKLNLPVVNFRTRKSTGEPDLGGIRSKNGVQPGMGSPPDKIKDGRNAFIVSVAIVLFFVGTNYIDTTFGRLGEIGDKLETLGIVMAVLPVILLIILSEIGIEIPLWGRDSFVESDIWIWIYWVLFYTLFIYFIIRSWKILIRYRYSKKAKQQQAS